MRTLAAASLSLLATAAQAVPAQDDHYLPLTKSAIVALAAQQLQSTTLKAEPMTLPPAQRSGLAPDETVWRINAAPLPVAIFLAGQGENIDALHVYFPVVNGHDDQDARVFAMLSALFKAIYPGWPDAGAWPRASMDTTWNTSLLVTRHMPANLDDLIARKTIDGITSATVGVPPDLVVYSITTREPCIPDVRRSNPFQRVVC